MGLRPRYKQTEVGVIPEEWENTSVRHLASSTRNAIVGGPFGSDLVSKDYVELGIPVIRGQNMGTKFLSGRFVFVTQLKAKSLESNLARPGDLLFTQRGTLGQVSLVPEQPFDRYLVSQSQMKVTVNRDAANPEFFFYLFSGQRHQEIIRESTIQTGVPHINLGILRDIPVQRPPVAEQKAIAEVLSDADALIESLEQLLTKKRLIKQGAMQKLLTGKKRLAEFNTSWQTRFMGDCFKLINTRNVELHDNVVTISAQLGFVRQEEFFNKRVASLVLENYYLIEKGDFAYNRSYSNGYPYGAIKRLTKYNKGVVTTLYICFGPKADAGVDPDFFEHYFEAGRLNAGLAGVANEGGRAHGLLNVTKADFFSREIQFPCLSEQAAIAAVLSDIDAEIAALENKLAKARQLKQGMMQELLTGRIRLV
jgi:type I restriction enzyme S subunit